MQNKKEYWYISYKGDLSLDIDKNKYKDRFRKQIGNYFKSVLCIILKYCKHINKL